MKTFRFVFVFGCLILFLTSCSKTTPPASSPAVSTPQQIEAKRIASADVVKATVQPVEIVSGGSGEVQVHLAIQPGYHVNANPPTYPYLKATELEVSPAEGVSAGKVIYPPALNRKFPFAEQPLAVYEGETQVKVTLKLNQKATPGERALPAKLRVQACDDEVCYPPGTIDLKIPLTIK